MFGRKQTTTNTSSSSSFSYLDIDQMPEIPNRGSHHRRSQSESFLHFPDDLLLDPDLDLLDNTNTPMVLESSTKSDDSSSSGPNQNPNKPLAPTAAPAHLRSLSVDAEFFDGILGFSAPTNSSDGGNSEDKCFDGPRGGHLHRHSYSMDGTTSFEAESGMLDGIKKAMAPEKLAELALIDPKRAKRILANRQSAARSKERKIRYTGELERKVQTLQTEATTLSTQVTMLQRDTSGLTSENRELKLRLQAMEQQARLREALNDALKEEVQRLKIATGQMPPANGNTFNRGMSPQFASQQHYGSNQTQQNQPQMQPQIHLSNHNPTSGRQLRPSFLDFS